MGVLEEWKPVAEPGYEDLYEVSTQGRVRSLPRSIKASNRTLNYPRRLLKQNLDSRCYPQVVLCRETKRKTKAVHRLVAEAFIGRCPPGYQVMHLNSVPYDCRLSNLAYGSRSENVKEAIRIGTHNRSPEYQQIDWKTLRVDSKAKLDERLSTLDRSF